MGIDPEIVQLWADGVHLEGHEHAPIHVMEEYPSVDDPRTAARELGGSLLPERFFGTHQAKYHMIYT